LRNIVLIALFSFWLFGKEVTVSGYGKDIDRISSFKIAIADAQAEASSYFHTKVQTHYSKSESLQNGEIYQKRIDNSTFQISESEIELLDYKKSVKENYIPEHGITLYITEIKARFKIIEKNETSEKHHQKNIVADKVVKVKKVQQKKESVQQEKIVKKPEKINFKAVDRLKSFKGLDKYIFIVPSNRFKEFQNLYFQFSKNSSTYEEISKYFYKIDKYLKIEKPDIKQKYSLLLSDGEFIFFANRDEKPIFHNLDLDNEIVNLEFSDTLFRYW
jgi:hypothetical protein